MQPLHRRISAALRAFPSGVQTTKVRMAFQGALDVTIAVAVFDVPVRCRSLGGFVGRLRFEPGLADRHRRLACRREFYIFGATGTGDDRCRPPSGGAG